MRTDRRSFLRLLAGAAALVSGKASAARPTSEPIDIHEATRNTRLGALGARRPRLSAPPPDHKDYPGSRRLALPAPSGEPARTLTEIVRHWALVEPSDEGEISLAELGRLLYFSNGITRTAPPGTSGEARRAAPSAGALYSGEVYVAAARVHELPPGVYYYEVAQHRLVEVSAKLAPADLGAALGRPASLGVPAATILLSNVFGRYSWRYANRGYRYALIDSGHIGENLRLAAASAGLAQAGALAFQDDLLNELLEIDGSEEAVCAVHAVGRADSSGDAKAKPTPTSSETRSSWAEAQRVPGFAVHGSITERYHAATKLIPSRGAVARSETSRTLPPREIEVGLPLPARAVDPTMTLEDAIRIRRSTARFESGALSLADLAYVLEMAHGHIELAQTGNVALYLVVHRVGNLAPGIYRYERDPQRLITQRSESLVREFTRVCLGQQKAGSAAVGILMVADLGDDRALASTRRYRDTLIESGAIAQRIYLAAESAGVSARNLAAFIDDDLNRLLGLDDRREAVVHLTMLGPGD